MWPTLLDMTEEESIQSLRHLELEAYSSLISALRAQGPLNQQKRKLLTDTGLVLNICNDRHKAEVRRAINDERLNTIAYHITGQIISLEDWAQEGRRTVPLLPRVPPQTPYSLIADEASDDMFQYNKQLPLPANTERNRALFVQSTSGSGISNVEQTSSKTQQTFRIPDVPKEDFKKRKTTSMVGDNNSSSSSLAQHLLSNKLTKIQQIYRQASKSNKLKHKEHLNKKENKQITKLNINPFSHQNKLQKPVTPPTNKSNANIIIQKDEILVPKNTSSKPCNYDLVNENQAPKQYANSKINSMPSIKQQSTSSSQHCQDLVNKINPSPVLPTKLVNKSQKIIVVSSPPPPPIPTTPPSNSILQKTLSVPMNKLTKLNIENFKLLPPTTNIPVTNSPTKPKLVTLKASTTKKVIPLSQLQMLTTKNLKMVPYSGKVSTVNNDSVNKKLSEIITVGSSGKPDYAADSLSIENIKMKNLKSEEIVLANGISCGGGGYDESFEIEEINKVIDVDQDIEETGIIITEIDDSELASTNEFNVAKYSTVID